MLKATINILGGIDKTAETAKELNDLILAEKALCEKQRYRTLCAVEIYEDNDFIVDLPLCEFHEDSWRTIDHFRGIDHEDNWQGWIDD
ncbi:hypothetical protein FACS189487_05700 [Campylobacterota bacterium]|nr:hypothetical protein FACS189487_05700 [Campylobacterota bacterium]